MRGHARFLRGVGDGDEEKSFHTRDGHGIVLLHRAGLRSGIISGRTSTLVERRARELGIPRVRLGVRVALPHLRARYERLGYRVYGERRREGYAEPIDLLMEKVL